MLGMQSASMSALTHPFIISSLNKSCLASRGVALGPEKGRHGSLAPGSDK